MSPGRKRNSRSIDDNGERHDIAGRDDGELRDDEGLLVDEYTSEAFANPDDLDALDVPAALEPESVLDDVADDSDGIEEVELLAPEDADAEMGLGAEPHTPEDLERAAIGRALRGPAGMTRDDEVHGERLLDAPDEEDERDDAFEDDSDETT